MVGKFDPLQRPEPYALAFASAFSQFVTQVIRQEAVRTVRTALVEAGIGEADLPVLVGMIPMLHHVIFPDDKATADADRRENNPGPLGHGRPPAGALKRFAYFFSLFLRAISTLGVPLVLVLDDLHFADESSLQILSNTVADLPNCPSLFVVVTYDADSKCYHGFVQDALAKLSSETSGCNTSVTQVAVGNMGREDVGRFLADALHATNSQQTTELASLVYDQTNGIFFCVNEFVKHLLNNNLLEISDSEWRFDVPKIQTAVTFGSAKDILTFKLDALSPELQLFLKVVSCCGTFVPIHLLQYLYGDRTVPLLQEAPTLKLLKRDATDSDMMYSFPHDIIQQSVYGMIPDDERGRFHLEIGRRMWNAIKSADLEVSLFVLTSQFYFAKHFVVEPKERCDLARLCLLAGKKAAASSTFRTACVYLNLGIEFLRENGWRDQYQLSLALYVRRRF